MPFTIETNLTSPTIKSSITITNNTTPIKKIRTQLRNIAIQYINEEESKDRPIEYFSVGEYRNFNNFKYTIRQFIYQYNEEDAKLINVVPTMQSPEIDPKVCKILTTNIDGSDCYIISELAKWCSFELYAFPDGLKHTQEIALYIQEIHHVTNTLCQNRLGYTFFIDRSFATKDDKTYKDTRKYGPEMFDITNNDCVSGKYLEGCFYGLNIALTSELKFTERQDFRINNLQLNSNQFIYGLTCEQEPYMHYDNILKFEKNEERLIDIKYGDIIHITINGSTQYLECIDPQKKLFYLLTLSPAYSTFSPEEIAIQFTKVNKLMLFNNNTSQAISTFKLFKEIATTTQSKENILTIRHKTIGPEGYIHLYYNIPRSLDLLEKFEGTVYEYRGENSRYYNPQKVLNPCCEFDFQRVRDEYRENAFYGELSNVEYGLSVSSRYASELQIMQFYTKQLNDFQQAFSRITTERQKIAVIITFTSILEACHYFENGNNRLFCQIILNKLLIEAELPPSILRIPNGFSRFVLCSLPETLRFGDVSFANIDLDELTDSLEVAINAVVEGQQFYQYIREQFQVTEGITQETK